MLEWLTVLNDMQNTLTKCVKGFMFLFLKTFMTLSLSQWLSKILKQLSHFFQMWNPNVKNIQNGAALLGTGVKTPRLPVSIADPAKSLLATPWGTFSEPYSSLECSLKTISLNFETYKWSGVTCWGWMEYFTVIQGQTSLQPWEALSQTLIFPKKGISPLSTPYLHRRFLCLIRPSSQLLDDSNGPFICFSREYSNLF